MKVNLFSVPTLMPTSPIILIMPSQLLGMLYSLDEDASLGHPRSKARLLIPQELLSITLLMLLARKSFGSANSLTNLVSGSLLNQQLSTLTANLPIPISTQCRSTLRTGTSKFRTIGFVNKSSWDWSRLNGFLVRKILLMFSRRGCLVHSIGILWTS